MKKYDAVIIGHSQFERIPLSFERQGTAVSYQAETSERAENGNRGERRSWDPEL